MMSLLGLLVRQLLALSVGVLVVLVFSLLISVGTDELMPTLPFVLRLGLVCFLTLVLLFEVPRIQAHLRHRSRLLADVGRAVGKGWEQRWMKPFAVVVTLLLSVVALLVRWVWTGGQAGVLLSLPMTALLVHSTVWLGLASLRRLHLWWASRGIEAARAAPPAFPVLAGIEVLVAGLLAFARLPHAAVVLAPVVVGLVALQSMLEGDDRYLEVLVELGPDDTIDELDYLAGVGRFSRATPAASRWESAEASQTWVMRVPTMLFPLALGLLLDDQENVADVELNKVIATGSQPTVSGACPTAAVSTRDPLSGGQVALRDTGAEELLRPTWLNRPPRVALLGIIDTGVTSGHEDLSGVIRGRAGPDNNGHGTAMAGVAAAIGNNGVGMASLNDRGAFMMVRDYPALARAGGGNIDDIADALFQAVDDGADVVLMAFGAKGKAPRIVQRAVEHALARGVVLVAAAGNNGPVGHANDQWPANLPGVLAVAALDGNRLAGFSSRVGHGGIGAPGKGICAPLPGLGYRQLDGTSPAAAFVAGAVARRRAQCGEAAAETLRAVATTAAPATAARPAALRVDRLLARCSSW